MSVSVVFVKLKVHENSSVPLRAWSGRLRTTSGGKVAFGLGVTEMLKLSTALIVKYCTVLPLIQLRTSVTELELYWPKV